MKLDWLVGWLLDCFSYNHNIYLVFIMYIYYIIFFFIAGPDKLVNLAPVETENVDILLYVYIYNNNCNYHYNNTYTNVGKKNY